MGRLAIVILLCGQLAQMWKQHLYMGLIWAVELGQEKKVSGSSVYGGRTICSL
ncbi:hypothetical protein INR49_016223 [Caranx melampygus]|nr:hypothetical protein INR49_016223 [Caranx melampygus]